MKKKTSPENEALLENEVAAETSTEETSETRELTEVEKLINKRTGYWRIGLEESDLKWIRNQCNSKFSFAGPNEAFMLMNCYLGFSGAIARLEQAAKAGMEQEAPAVQAAALEACAMLINRYEGSGIESAQRIFRIAVALNQPISEMKKLDDQISALKAQQSNPE